jgi:N-acetylglucosaminyl-diphospho-decaprenol L-rhamnosyltransferase
MRTLAGDGQPPTLSIIIANYNARDRLGDCLASIYEHPPREPFDVFVVDDASSDDSVAMVRARFPEVQLLVNERNVNYGRANNRALVLARGRYIHLLNNDTIILPGALDSLIAFLDANPRAGAVGSRLIDRDGTVQASAKSLPSVGAAFFGRRSPLSHLFPNNRFTRKHLLHLAHDMTRPFTAGLVSGASVMIRRAVVEQIGTLDERFFYHIDADYSRRIWDAGWDVYYLPAASVIHLEHQGGSMSSPRRRFKGIVEFHRGSYMYFRKHDMGSAWHPMHFVVIGGLSARFVISLLLQLGKEAARIAGARRGRPRLTTSRKSHAGRAAS